MIEQKAVWRWSLVAVVLSAAIAIAALLVMAVGPAGAQDSAAPENRSEADLTTEKSSAGDFSAAADGLHTEDLSGPLEPSDLVNTLLGSGVSNVSNVSYKTGPTPVDRAAGKFSGGGSGSGGIIGFEDGIILSSGDVANVVGPNQSDAITEFNNPVGDSELSNLTGRPTYDATVLEFDFTPNANEIFFEYVFASDEYNEFVNSPFDDVFGFFVNGGTNNCATVGNNERVSINSINNGNPFGSGGPNSQLYRNNDLSDGGGSIDTEMDGLTTVLVCEASVTPDESNHIKLAIADTSDQSLDSNVFLKGGSFSTEPPGNQPPVVQTAAADANGTEGGTLSTNGAFSDPDNEDSDPNNDNQLTITKTAGEGTVVDNGDGSWSWSLPTNDDASGSVTVSASDGKGGTVTDTFDYSAVNAKPVLSALSLDGNNVTACTGANNTITLGFSITDPGTADTHSGTIDWGDSSSETFTGSSVSGKQHSYSPGTYTITVNASDDDGGSAQEKTDKVSLLYNLTNSQDGSVLLSPVNADGSSVFKAGSVIPLKVEIEDCSGQPVSGLKPKVGWVLASSANPTQGINENVSSVSAADTDNIMREVDSRYQYNLATKSLPDVTATYKMVFQDSTATSTNPADFGPTPSQNLGIRTK